jgi:hypothetical protein
MRGLRYWVHFGEIQPMFRNLPLGEDQEEGMFKEGGVRLTTGDLGTEVRWHVQSPCVTAAFKTMEWLNSTRGPFILRFYAMGWFEETFADAKAAARRMEQIVARGDRHFATRVFIEEGRKDSQRVPEVLRLAIDQGTMPADFTVDSSFDSATHQFRVERVGAMTPIGRFYGTYTSSYPCQDGGSYSVPVNETYHDVLRTGKPRYDHVLAVMRLPDNALHWVPYQRVVIPRRLANGRDGVAVVSQLAPVDIQVI